MGRKREGPFAHGAYTVRQKFWKFFGAAFYILDEEGGVVGYCSQKAFKLKEDIRVYTDDSMTHELLVIKARSIIDFGATYDVTDPADGDRSVGSYRRKGWTSLVRDEWLIFDADGDEVGKIQEDSAGLAIVRRIIGGLALLIAPQAYHLEIDGRKAAEMVTSRNPFIYKLNVTIDSNADGADPRIILAGAILLSAIEGRQGEAVWTSAGKSGGWTRVRMTAQMSPASAGLTLAQFYASLLGLVGFMVLCFCAGQLAVIRQSLASRAEAAERDRSLAD